MANQNNNAVKKVSALKVLETLKRAYQMGGKRFASFHGFKPGKYMVRFRNVSLPSKAVLGVAAGAAANTFSGGVAHAVRILRKLGFQVIAVAKIALVACSASKLGFTAAARDLYTGDFFRKAVAFAERCLDGFAILSAKHGVVQPEEQVAPYDQRLSSRKADRKAWERQVLAQLRSQYAEGTIFVLLCGKDYRSAIELSEDLYCDLPLAGCRGLGDMKSWLKRNTAAAA